jgi:hypothetical protein
MNCRGPIVIEIEGERRVLAIQFLELKDFLSGLSSTWAQSFLGSTWVFSKQVLCMEPLSSSLRSSFSGSGSDIVAPLSSSQAYFVPCAPFSTSSCPFLNVTVMRCSSLAASLLSRLILSVCLLCHHFTCEGNVLFEKQ